MKFESDSGTAGDENVKFESDSGTAGDENLKFESDSGTAGDENFNLKVILTQEVMIIPCDTAL